MSQIHEQGLRNGCRRTGTVRCRFCDCVFSYVESDIEYRANMWGGELYYYLSCANESCQRDLVIKDNRFFWAKWFDRLDVIRTEALYVESPTP